MNTIPKQLQREHDLMNAGIEAAIQIREDWYREHLTELAEFQPGDRIYARVASNDYKLQYAGIVTEVYLKVFDRHDRLREPKVCYKFTRAENYLYGSDTDSDWASFHTHKDWVLDHEIEIGMLERQIENPR